MGAPDPLGQLEALNQWLAEAGGSDPERAAHARHALEFFRREQGGGRSAPCFARCARQLARLHLGNASETGKALAHWEVPQTEGAAPLWVREAVVAEMKKLAGRRGGVLLVTGLREALAPEGRYWTRRREAQYRRVRGWIETLACAWASRGSRVHVVVF